MSVKVDPVWACGRYVNVAPGQDPAVHGKAALDEALAVALAAGRVPAIIEVNVRVAQERKPHG